MTLHYEACASQAGYLNYKHALRKCNSYYFSGWCPVGTPAGSNLGEHYQILYIQSSAPDDGRKYRLKHVEPIINLYSASCWLFS